MKETTTKMKMRTELVKTKIRPFKIKALSGEEEDVYATAAHAVASRSYATILINGSDGAKTQRATCTTNDDPAVSWFSGRITHEEPCTVSELVGNVGDDFDLGGRHLASMAVTAHLLISNRSKIMELAEKVKELAALPQTTLLEIYQPAENPKTMISLDEFIKISDEYPQTRNIMAQLLVIITNVLVYVAESGAEINVIINPRCENVFSFGPVRGYYGFSQEEVTKIINQQPSAFEQIASALSFYMMLDRTTEYVVSSEILK